MHRILLIIMLLVSLTSLAQNTEFSARLSKGQSAYSSAKDAITKKNKALFTEQKGKAEKYAQAAQQYAKTSKEKSSAQSLINQIRSLKYVEQTTTVIDDKPKPEPVLPWRVRWEAETRNLVITNGKETVTTRMVEIPSDVTPQGTAFASYMIADREVTQLLWNVVMKSDRSRKDLMPVTEVSWEDCMTFITKLNDMTSMQFRLPEDFEWEYAANGGKASRNYTFAGSNDVSAITWTDRKMHNVAGKAPNELGLYDMSGNVWEWTNSREGSDRVIKGGSYFEADLQLYKKLKPNSHEHQPVSYHNSYLGLRLALSIVIN